MAALRKTGNSIEEIYHLDHLAMLVKDAPTIDAVEVVRCKDCVYRDQAFRCIALYYGFNPHDDWFCANGKKDAEVNDGQAEID